MAKLDSNKRGNLPDSAFAYIDSKGARRLPIHDESHVRNALSRFNQVRFENEEARERARTRLLKAAKKHGIVPVGFMDSQLQSERAHAAAGRLVIEIGRGGAPGQLEDRLRSVLRDPTLTMLLWSDSAQGYIALDGSSVAIPESDTARAVTYLERGGRPVTALVHHPKLLKDGHLSETVLAAVQFVIENDRRYGQIEATASDAADLPCGIVTLMMTDIESSTGLLHQLGDRYAKVLREVRAIQRKAVIAAGGREIDARGDEYFAVFARACDAILGAADMQQNLSSRKWPESVEVRIRAGLHIGVPTLTDVGYVGLAVHTAARVCAAAHGGQILLSRATRFAADEFGLTQFRFRSLGLHSLAGLTEPEELFQVEAEGLLPDFPALRTV